MLRTGGRGGRWCKSSSPIDFRAQRRQSKWSSPKGIKHFPCQIEYAMFQTTQGGRTGKLWPQDFGAVYQAETEEGGGEAPLP